MKYVQISIDNNASNFKPGDQISGTASWQLEESAKTIEVRLFFYTEGKGTRDIEVLETLQLDSPPISGTQQFDWRLPQSPYSFSGKLISLIWAVEVVLLPSGEAESFEFQMTPTGKEIVLGTGS